MLLLLLKIQRVLLLKIAVKVGQVLDSELVVRCYPLNNVAKQGSPQQMGDQSSRVQTLAYDNFQGTLRIEVVHVDCTYEKVLDGNRQLANKTIAGSCQRTTKTKNGGAAAERGGRIGHSTRLWRNSRRDIKL